MFKLFSSYLKLSSSMFKLSSSYLKLPFPLLKPLFLIFKGFCSILCKPVSALLLYRQVKNQVRFNVERPAPCQQLFFRKGFFAFK